MSKQEKQKKKKREKLGRVEYLSTHRAVRQELFGSNVVCMSNILHISKVHQVLAVSQLNTWFLCFSRFNSTRKQLSISRSKNCWRERKKKKKLMKWLLLCEVKEGRIPEGRRQQVKSFALFASSTFFSANSYFFGDFKKEGNETKWRNLENMMWQSLDEDAN